MSLRSPSIAVLAFLLLVTASCNGSDGPIEPPESSSGAPTTSAPAEQCDLLTPSGVDLWPGLETDAAEFAATVRVLTADLTLNNRETCRPMVMVDSLVSPVTVGALAISSVEHQDPYVRIDLFVHDPALSDVNEAITLALGAELGEDMAFELSSPRPFLTMAVSWTDDGSGATPRGGTSNAPEALQETFRIATYYSSGVFGTE